MKKKLEKCNHQIDTDLSFSYLYLSKSLSKFWSAQNASSNKRYYLCISCGMILENAKELDLHSSENHTLYLTSYPIHIFCYNCKKKFECPKKCMNAVLLSLPSFPGKFLSSGFRNLGNTCYSCAVLMALSSCRQIVTAASVSAVPICKAFSIAANQNRNFNIILHQLLGFDRYTQQDSAEFLVKILDSFSEDKLMKKIFTGKIKTNVICYDCNEHREIYEDFSLLNIPIQKEGWEGLTKRSNCYCRGYGESMTFKSGNANNSFISMIQHGNFSSFYLEKCLESLFLPSNGKCEKCGSKNCEIISSFGELPEVLILQLNRYGKRWFGLGKYYYHVSFPYENVDFSKFLPDTIECNNCIYDLFSVIFHSGSMNSGHYQCYSKVSNKWYQYNDSEVTEVNLNTVLEDQCYILFYQKHVNQEVINIRKNISLNCENLDVGIPIFCLSDSKKWLNSVPYSQTDHLFDEANAYACGKVTREYTEDDLRQQFIYRFPFSTLDVPISYQYGKYIYNFLTSDVPIPDLSQEKSQDESYYLTGKEMLLFLNQKDQKNQNEIT